MVITDEKIGMVRTTYQNPFNIVWSRNSSERCNHAGHSYTGSSEMSYASQSSSQDISSRPGVTPTADMIIVPGWGLR